MSDPKTPATRTRRWGERERGNITALRFYFHFSRVVGRVLGYFCTGPALLYYMLFAGKARRASFEYLDRALGPSNIFVRVARGFRHIFNFAASMVDRSLLLSRGKKTFDFTTEHTELLKEMVDSGSGGMVFCTHLGNTELASAVLPIPNARFHQVMADPMDADLQEFLEEKGGDMFPSVIRLDGAPMASLKLLRVIRDGNVVGMKVDRVLDENYVKAPFFGADAVFPTGPWILAATFKSPIVFVYCMKEGGKGYRIICEGPHTFTFNRKQPKQEQLEEWIRWFAGHLEDMVRRYPYQWYNFYSVWDEQEAISSAPARDDSH